MTPMGEIYGIFREMKPILPYRSMVRLLRRSALRVIFALFVLCITVGLCVFYARFMDNPVLSKTELKYSRGLFETAAGRLYVNPGIGTYYWPVRFLCRPEITIIEL
jgi:hypothetical protein